MKRAMIVCLVPAGAALLLGACDDGSSGGGTVYAYVACNQFSSCETCTPVIGCGWCAERSQRHRCYGQGGAGHAVAAARRAQLLHYLSTGGAPIQVP